ncbi:MAG: hypothetical protein IJU40_06935, partial [Desulfovibrionaceae bacterium]|nr:hypothetical protein [Desulfovibrionaceae bacterium]
RGSTVLGGTNTEGVSLASKATLSLKGKNDLSQLHFKVGEGTFNLKSQGNTLGILATQAKSKVNFELNALKPSNQPLLKLLNANTSNQGSFSLKVSTSQKLGSYILTKNWQPTKAPSFNLYVDNKKQGSLKLEGSTLVLNGVSYSLKKVDSTIKVDLAIKAGQILAKNSAKIVGTNHSDIISGQNGNNLIEGKNGRDVLIYDTSNWGKDIVAKTKGTITLLFSGLKARDLNLKFKGQDLLITRKDKPKQEILLKSYAKERCSLVYTNSLQAFSSYLKAASPTESMQEKVKKEVWQKAGLAKA